MTSVAFLTVHDRVPWLRHTPGDLGRWKNCNFWINQGTMEADWLVVYDDPKAAVRTRVPKSRRVIVITEPPGIKEYRPGFLDQFGIMLSPMPVPGFRGTYLHTDVGLPWTFGLDYASTQHTVPCRYSYDQLAALTAGEKRPILSTVTSAKARLPRHRARVEFVRALAERLGDRFHHYGRGFRPVGDKAEAILPYTHHLAIENNDEDSFFTEKITDAYLGWSLPIFSGCRNIETFFPSESLIRFDLTAPDAIERVVAALDEPITERRFAAIAEARAAVLERYNIFARLTDILSGLDSGAGARVNERLKPNEHYGPLRKRMKLAWRRFRKQLFSR
jgi:hypothetical protein